MPDEPIRIVLVNMRKLLLEIVEQHVAPQPDMVVVGQFAKAIDLIDAVERTGADVVITSATDENLAGVGVLLRERPAAKVLALDDDGRTVLRYDVRWGWDVAPQTLLGAIRAAAREDAYELV